MTDGSVKSPKILASLYPFPQEEAKRDFVRFIMSNYLEAACGIALNGLAFISHSSEETYSFGKCLGETLQPGDVVALSGELGSGKTCFVQGIARGLGVAETYAITSPTFTLINEYPGRLILYHLDMYRLSGVRDLDDIGYEACFNDRGVVVVEWAEKIRETLPEGTLFIFFEYLDENNRKLVLSDSDDKLRKIFSVKKGGW